MHPDRSGDAADGNIIFRHYRSRRQVMKSEIHAYQASKRGGHLYCELLEHGRIRISGEATLIAISDILVDFLLPG
jgi:hypothetical protein